MKKSYKLVSGLSLFVILLSSLQCKKDNSSQEWREYLGGGDKNHYSELDQITADNVKDLKVVWSYSLPDSGQLQVNPIIVDGVLFGVSSSVQPFAIDAATGKEIWKFGDPLADWASTSRGVTYWKKGYDKRILFTAGPNLWALDAITGKPIATFGNQGKVDLHTGLPEIAKDKFIISNTPGTIFEDNIIMPVRLSEDSDAGPGDIRAFNVVTGKLAWTFHTIPYPGEFGYETFPADAYKNAEVGAANNWAGMAIDRKRGIVFVPTGSASYDFYGGNRTGQNLFSNCLLALDARTGKRLWHFQTMHHDIWDRDLPAPPNLITVTHDGRKIDAVAQVSKQGYVYLFERETGKPLFPINEVAAPSSTLVGEATWPTQPVPSKPAPFARQSHMLTENDISPFAPDRATLIEKFKKYKTQQFAPPSKEGTVIFPGYDGGAEWGGAAADHEGILYVNSNEMAWILNMKDNPKNDVNANLPLGERIYVNYCASCHGIDLKGNAKSGYPTLLNINAKRDKVFVSNIITTGKGMMPGTTTIKPAEKQALIAYLFGEEKKEAGGGVAITAKPYLPYKGTGYNKFLDANGFPAISPPWGTLNAIDLNTGEYLWKIPFGETDSLKAMNYPTTGTENYGGPIVTASGLLFIAATKDGRFRAIDKKTGKIIWETKLPAAAFATPSTYMVNGKQYIAIACGGTKLGTAKGNMYIAFALPSK